MYTFCSWHLLEFFGSCYLHCLFCGMFMTRKVKTRPGTFWSPQWLCVPQPSTQVTRCHGSFVLLLVRIRKFHTFANEKGGCCWDKTSILSSLADSLWTSLSHLEITISLFRLPSACLATCLNCTSCKSSLDLAWNHHPVLQQNKCTIMTYTSSMNRIKMS